MPRLLNRIYGDKTRWTVGIFVVIGVAVWQSGVCNGDDRTSTFRDGDLVRNHPEVNVYQIKRENGSIYRRLIVSNDVMQVNGWVQDHVNNAVAGTDLGAIPISDLVRVAGSEDVYQLNLSMQGDSGTKRLVSVPYSRLEESDIDRDSVFEIKAAELDLYDTVDGD